MVKTLEKCLNMLEIYTDGSCLKNPGGAGGWAFVVVHNNKIIHEASGTSPSTTNNIMEMSAVIQALLWASDNAHGEAIHILTDSQYIINGIQEWSHNWIRNGWQTTLGKPVKNADLWKTLIGKTSILNPEFHWVKSHNNNPMNDRADELARNAAN
jgi:ribonuclease HI